MGFMMGYGGEQAIKVGAKNAIGKAEKKLQDEDGNPVTGITPILTARKTVDNSIVLNNVSMDEIGDGWYKYLFDNYDPETDYCFLADGGSQLESMRYVAASSFQDLQNLENPTVNFDV